jgi:hypothetical protein
MQNHAAQYISQSIGIILPFYVIFVKNVFIRKFVTRKQSLRNNRERTKQLGQETRRRVGTALRATYFA